VLTIVQSMTLQMAITETYHIRWLLLPLLFPFFRRLGIVHTDSGA